MDGAIEIVDGKASKRGKGRIDYTLRIRVNTETQPVAVGLIEAKAERPELVSRFRRFNSARRSEAV